MSSACASGLVRIINRAAYVLSVLASYLLISALDASACGGILDVGCNLKHGGLSPENIRKQTGKALEDTRKTAEKAGRDIDRWRLDLQSNVFTGPLLAAWFRRSRNDAAQGAMEIPFDVRQQLQGFVDPGSMASAKYKIGDGGALNLSHMSIQVGDAAAVTLIDVIVFRGPAEAGDLSIWIHELKHVEQFRRWGVDDFAARYMRSWNSVENEAYEAQNQYSQGISGTLQGHEVGGRTGALGSTAVMGRYCVTPFGPIGPSPPQPVGSSCLGDVPGRGVFQGVIATQEQTNVILTNRQQGASPSIVMGRFCMTPFGPVGPSPPRPMGMSCLGDVPGRGVFQGFIR